MKKVTSRTLYNVTMCSLKVIKTVSGKCHGIFADVMEKNRENCMF